MDKIKYLILLPAILCINILIFTNPSLAVEDKDILYPTIGKEYEYPSVSREAETAPVDLEKKQDKFKLGISTSLVGGYDSNVYLSHYDEVSSFFIQEALGIYGEYLLSDFCMLRSNYDLTSIKYARFSEPDLLDNIINVGFDTMITESLLWSVDYYIDFVGYPHDKASEYTMNEIETGLKHNITDSLYHKLTYRFSYKHYPKWKTRNRVGTVRLGSRDDRRNALEYLLGIYVTDKTALEIENTIYYNNSNELYLDYYDYTTLKSEVTIIQLITDKFYASLNSGYQYKAYKNRIVSDRDRGDQRDRLLMCGASLFYDIAPAISIGTNFDYRKNFSNEGEQKYADYIISGGVYCSF